VAGRDELAREVGSAPPELRTFVSAETAKFLAYEGAGYVLQGAIPGARQLPGLVNRVLDRLRSIAALG
jgi:hypothetical protein